MTEITHYTAACSINKRLKGVISLQIRKPKPRNIASASFSIVQGQQHRSGSGLEL